VVVALQVLEPIGHVPASSFDPRRSSAFSASKVRLPATDILDVHTFRCVDHPALKLRSLHRTSFFRKFCHHYSWLHRKEFPPGVRISKWAYWIQRALNNYRARAFTLQDNWTPMTPGRGRLH